MLFLLSAIFEIGAGLVFAVMRPPSWVGKGGTEANGGMHQVVVWSVLDFV